MIYVVSALAVTLAALEALLLWLTFKAAEFEDE